MGTDAFIDAGGLSLRTPVGRVYEGVSFRVDKGRVCCVFGEQGSGKTSLMLTVCGRMKASSGRLLVAGYDVSRQYRKVRQISGVSFIPGLNDVQSFLQVKSIAAAELALAGKHGNKENTDLFLSEWGFSDKKDVRFTDLGAYDTTLFGIVLAMAGDPRLLVVDDIQTGLTQHQSGKLMERLADIAADFGTTVLVGCTEYELARKADCVVVMGEAAERQRRAVVRRLGADAGPATPVAGSGNGAKVDRGLSAAGAVEAAAPRSERGASA